MAKARKSRPGTRYNSNDLKGKCIPSLQDYSSTKANKAKGSKIQTASYSSANPIRDNMDGNSSRNTSKKDRQSVRNRNEMDNKVFCVYRTEIKPDTPRCNNQLTYTFKSNNHETDDDDDIIYGKEIEKLRSKTNSELDTTNDENCEDYFDAMCIDDVDDITNIDNDIITEIDYSDYIDYISQKTNNTCKSKTKIKEFMETCDFVFNEFSEILFNAVTSENSMDSQMKSSTTTLVSIGT